MSIYGKTKGTAIEKQLAEPVGWKRPVRGVVKTAFKEA